MFDGRVTGIILLPYSLFGIVKENTISFPAQPVQTALPGGFPPFQKMG
ncbi:MAG: hypothetical protein HN862_05325 [Candidatus Scalindua sp.]|nr:hypothetical protein [Candidatus Scalindua sp.]MBT7589666.1 hypothetical protein [Candidatus Scalindua sp.]